MLTFVLIITLVMSCEHPWFFLHMYTKELLTPLFLGITNSMMQNV